MSTVVDYISSAKDHKLPEMVIEYIKERSLDEDTGCIQLLICKSSPFIRNMQKSINDRSSNSTKGYKALFAYLPTVEEVSENGDSCEIKYPYCSILF
ncbi:hypothetical protein NQ314_009249 [Rhamnusium bicolor]|uniref:Uncharacterized protein n=1 Tax=Rhamnusium bicolor TaxID=1586634 RepID=A0AAV8Y2H5_9CUCU|nr:hypothetical protein NQ314_009249 [Rhamnusium bicolor]